MRLKGPVETEIQRMRKHLFDIESQQVQMVLFMQYSLVASQIRVNVISTKTMNPNCLIKCPTLSRTLVRKSNLAHPSV